jgi:hypothetical protein
MGLFQPKTVKDLRIEIVAAHMALSMSSDLPPDHQARIAVTAPSEVATAAAAAAAAGHGIAAKQMLIEQRSRAPRFCPAGTTWLEVIQAGLDAVP